MDNQQIQKAVETLKESKVVGEVGTLLTGKPRIACWFCGSDLIWNADFDFEDFDFEGEGIVAVLTCTGCEADAHFRKEV